MPAPHSEGPDVILVASDARYAELRKRWFGNRDVIDIPRLERTAACRAYRFDIGHPVDGQAYVRHPCRPGHYLVPAQANERMAQEKVAAFTQIAAALGARTVELISAESSQRQREANLSIPVLAKTLGLSGELTREGHMSRHLHARFDTPARRVEFPVELRQWLETDPILRSLVTIRLTQRPLHYKVALNISDVFERGGKVDLQLSKLGVGAGAKTTSIGNSTWYFEVEFWPTDDASETAALTTLQLSSPQILDAPHEDNDENEVPPPRQERRIGVVPMVLALLAIAAVSVVTTLVLVWPRSSPTTTSSEHAAPSPPAASLPAALPTAAVDGGADRGAPPGRVATAGKKALDESSLTPDAVLRKIMSAYMRGLKDCHKHLLRTDPTARGKVNLKFTVNESGRAISPEVRGFNDGLDRCIEDRIPDWRFDVPRDAAGEPAQASFSIALQLVPG